MGWTDLPIEIRMELAQHANDIYILNKLIMDERWLIRALITQNPNVTTLQLIILECDSSSLVSDSAKAYKNKRFLKHHN